MLKICFFAHVSPNAQTQRLKNLKIPKLMQGLIQQIPAKLLKGACVHWEDGIRERESCIC